MARPIVEAQDLPFAVQWEQIRENWFRHVGDHNTANHCRELADHFEARLKNHLLNQLK